MVTFRSIIEIIYYLSAPALVLVAFYGLKQIKIAAYQLKETRETRKIQSKRESFTIAAEQCKYYVEKIIPLLNNLDEIIEEKNLEFFTKSEIIIEPEIIKVKAFMENDALNKVIDECIEEVSTVLNYIEGFSVYFVSGVASDIVGFRTLGNIYVKSVKLLLPALAVRKEGYINIKSLFMTWNSRIISETLNKDKATIEEKLKKQKTYTIDTIGTK